MTPHPRSWPGFTRATILSFMVLSGSLAVQAQRARTAHPWVDRSLSPEQRTELVLKEMTLEEKVVLVHGAGKVRPANWLGGAGYAAGIPRLGIPEVQSSNGRSGVGQAGPRGRYATALPCALALSATWDLALSRDYGALMGKECRQLGFQISLGGTANLVREPRCGRNFECFGEDPILIGKMLAEELKATQAQGVIANINRYALNDQETARGSYDVVMDKRTMRETDLLAFEIAIKESGVGTVMGAYNRLNGVYCCENSYLLNDVLKEAWGYKGWVMSDWGGTHSTTAAVMAGLDQEMAGGKYLGDALREAVAKGEVPLARLDDMVRRILRTEFAFGVLDRAPEALPAMSAPDPFAGAAVAQEVAEQGIVLLKNADGQLPLEASRLSSIAVIGSHADVGVLSGGGSDQVDPAGGNPVPKALAVWRFSPQQTRTMVWHPSAPLKAIRLKVPGADVRYDPGTNVAAAVQLASGSSVAIVFVHQYNYEGFDVPDLSLPERQDELVAAVAAANPHTIVVLENGGPVTMPWLGKAGAVVEAWYPGIRGGEAVANVLFGQVNPSAKLTVTFPGSEAELPQANLPGSKPSAKTNRQFQIHYAEGLRVGYKWFDAEGKEPLFPFGFGLAYTTYAYSDLKITAGETLQVSFKVTNTGRRAGAEIAQVYASLPAAADEPPKRLVAWEKIPLRPGEARTVTVPIEALNLSIFSVPGDKWQLLPGEYGIFVGGSSRSTPLHETVRLGG
jgi:beta-glucosidase